MKTYLDATFPLDLTLADGHKARLIGLFDDRVIGVLYSKTGRFYGPSYWDKEGAYMDYRRGTNPNDDLPPLDQVQHLLGGE